eukprot:4599-Heterococcus_DN1.PRE.4
MHRLSVRTSTITFLWCAACVVTYGKGGAHANGVAQQHVHSMVLVHAMLYRQEIVIMTCAAVTRVTRSMTV